VNDVASFHFDKMNMYVCSRAASWASQVPKIEVILLGEKKSTMSSEDRIHWEDTLGHTWNGMEFGHKLLQYPYQILVIQVQC